MHVIPGKVVDGKIVIEGEPLEEGTVVTVVVSDEGPWVPTPKLKAELLASLQEVERGELIQGPDFCRDLGDEG